MRCKGCDAIMLEVDLDRINPHTNAPEDLCGVCLKGTNLEAFSDLDDQGKEVDKYIDDVYNLFSVGSTPKSLEEEDDG